MFNNSLQLASALNKIMQEYMNIHYIGNSIFYNVRIYFYWDKVFAMSNKFI